MTYALLVLFLSVFFGGIDTGGIGDLGKTPQGIDTGGIGDLGVHPTESGFWLDTLDGSVHVDVDFE